MDRFSTRNLSTYANILDIDMLSESYKSEKKVDSVLVETFNWTANNHNISYSYTPGDNIYINITSNSNYKSYSKNIKNSDLIMSLETFHNIICRTFESSSLESETNYKLTWVFTAETLKLTFLPVFEGFFSVNQTIELKENILTPDKVLTCKLTEMEIKLNMLEKRISELETSEIIFGYKESGGFFSLSLNITELTLPTGYLWLGNYMDFNKLKYLKNITLNTNQFQYRRGVIDIKCSAGISYYLENGSMFLNYISNIFDTPLIVLPSVEKIKIIRDRNDTMPTNFISLPNLANIIFSGYSTIDAINLIKNLKKLKRVDFLSCGTVQKMEEITTWCNTNGIATYFTK